MSDHPERPGCIISPTARIHAYTNLYGCIIGEDTSVGAFVEIQKEAIIGSRCKIGTHTFICSGVTIQDEVFIGHHVCFSNDDFPRAVTSDGQLEREIDWKHRFAKTLVERGAVIGNSASIRAGITIGEGAFVGIGAVVVRDVEPWTIVVGNPARTLRKRETN